MPPTARSGPRSTIREACLLPRREPLLGSTGVPVGQPVAAELVEAMLPFGGQSIRLIDCFPASPQRLPIPPADPGRLLAAHPGHHRHQRQELSSLAERPSAALPAAASRRPCSPSASSPLTQRSETPFATGDHGMEADGNGRESAGRAVGVIRRLAHDRSMLLRSWSLLQTRGVSRYYVMQGVPATAA
jgi:hypothetical protein